MLALIRRYYISDLYYSLRSLSASPLYNPDLYSLFHWRTLFTMSSPNNLVSELAQVVPEPIEIPKEGTPESELFNVTPDDNVWKRIIKKLRLIQKYSAYGFLGFFGLHVTSTIVAPGIGLSPETCQDLFEMCRNVYLGPIFEYSMIYTTVGLHVGSGIALRCIDTRKYRKTFLQKQKEIIIKDGERDDIGLGGLGTLLGLGFKKSWISTHFPSLTPLTFSGYIMFLSLAFHFFKMRVAPILIDGDSSLITLRYVTHYLKQSHYGTAGKAINYIMLLLLLGVSFYHVVSGLFKYRRQFSLRAKKIAYGVIGTFTALSVVAMARFSRWNLESGFIGKQFMKYLHLI